MDNISLLSSLTVFDYAHYDSNYDTSDELIRQITINCAERGLLLLR